MRVGGGRTAYLIPARAWAEPGSGGVRAGRFCGSLLRVAFAGRLVLAATWLKLGTFAPDTPALMAPKPKPRRPGNYYYDYLSIYLYLSVSFIIYNYISLLVAGVLMATMNNRCYVPGLFETGGLKPQQIARLPIA